MKAAYTGNEVLTFMDYLDLDTGKTLTAEPGRVYDITPAGGRLVEDIPEPWFARVAEPKTSRPAKEADQAAPGEPAS